MNYSNDYISSRFLENAIFPRYLWQKQANACILVTYILIFHFTLLPMRNVTPVFPVQQNHLHLWIRLLFADFLLVALTGLSSNWSLIDWIGKAS